MAHLEPKLRIISRLLLFVIPLAIGGMADAGTSTTSTAHQATAPMKPVSNQLLWLNGKAPKCPAGTTAVATNSATDAVGTDSAGHKYTCTSVQNSATATHPN